MCVNVLLRSGGVGDKKGELSVNVRDEGSGLMNRDSAGIRRRFKLGMSLRPLFLLFLMGSFPSCFLSFA